MDQEQNVLWRKRAVLYLLCSVVLAVGCILSALIFANAVSERPMNGNFSGTLVSGGGEYPNLIGLKELSDYLAWAAGEDGKIYEKYALRDHILSGEWPGFPYVRIEGTLYFSKEAVDTWFLEQAQQQRVIE